MVKCAMCGEMTPVEAVNKHATSCRPTAFAAPSHSAMVVSYPSDFEQQMRSIYNSPHGVMMESLEEQPTIDIGPADSVYRLSLPDGRMAGWVAKRGAGKGALCTSWSHARLLALTPSLARLPLV